MAEKKAVAGGAAVDERVKAALAGLDAIGQLHKDQLIGQYDAAVTGPENGKPRVVKRMDRPHIRVIPEWFGGGTLPRKELHEAAAELTASQAGLIAVGEPATGNGLGKARTGAAQSREACRRGHDRRNHQRVARSAQGGRHGRHAPRG